MRSKYRTHHILEFVLLFVALTGLPAGNLWADEDSRYLEAVREFADNVLKHGRDTYGPKHTPLFVDGLNVHTREPVKWIDPDGTRWILSNFASQQTLMRTLDGLSAVSGDSKYKQAAMDAMKYAFENLRAPNGLLYWGHSLAYDAQEDIVRTSDEDGSRWHCLKLDYPHYQMMWDADPNTAKQFIESYWSAHILDWSNLDMDRGSKISQDLEEAWNHQYKEVPAFSRGKGVAFLSTGSSLIQAAVFLHRQSGQEEPLIWSKRLAKRYVDTRHPNTGISATTYNKTSPLPLDDFKTHFDDPRTVLFPYDIRKANEFYYPERTHVHAWIALILTDLMLSPKDKAFTQWALEELTTWGKVAYRKEDNAFIPMLTDGTSLEGYVIKKDNILGPEGTVIQPYVADLSFFWAYSLAYRATGDEFMWKMARSIARGHGFGDLGEDPESITGLGVKTRCSDAYGLLGFLELYAKTNSPEHLKIAKRIGDNILETRFHKGYFVPSEKHTFTRFDTFEPLALLHLVAAIGSGPDPVPQVWPSCPLFYGRYRHRDKGIDRQIIYPTTESSEPPLSLQEAAAIGDVTLITALIRQGHDVDERDDVLFRTALHRAVMKRHKEVVELLLAEGANANVKDQWPGLTPLHYAVENNFKEIAELLLSKGADVDARRDYPAGDTPLHSAARKGHKDIVDLLIKKGADVNARNDKGETPIKVVGDRNRQEIVDLLKKHGAIEGRPQSTRKRFQRMSLEEREKFREQMRARFGGNTQRGQEPSRKQEKPAEAEQKTGQSEVADEPKAPKSVRDVAVSGVSAPAVVTKGDNVAVTVSVKDQGNFEGTFDVTLIDETDLTTISVESVTLSAASGGMDEIADLTFDGQVGSNNYFGDYVAVGGDVNGDGYNDILISSAGYPNGGMKGRGRAYTAPLKW